MTHTQAQNDCTIIAKEKNVHTYLAAAFSFVLLDVLPPLPIHFSRCAAYFVVPAF